MRSNFLSSVALGATTAMLLVGSVAAAGNGAGGVSGPAIYVGGQLYRTVGTPTDFSHTGAPDHSYDTIYAFPDPESEGDSLQPSVAELAPGDPGYNGGRWQVKVLSFDNYEAAVSSHDANGSGNLDTAAEVEAALQAGDATVSAGPSFECPIIPVPKGKSH